MPAVRKLEFSGLEEDGDEQQAGDDGQHPAVAALDAGQPAAEVLAERVGHELRVGGERAGRIVLLPLVGSDEAVVPAGLGLFVDRQHAISLARRGPRSALRCPRRRGSTAPLVM